MTAAAQTKTPLIIAVSSPENTPDNRIVLHFDDGLGDGTYECLLTPGAAIEAALLILWRLGDLPSTVVADEPERMGINVAGSVDIGLRPHDRSPVLRFNMNGVKAGINLSIPALRQLQREIEAALTQITAAAEQTTAH